MLELVSLGVGSHIMMRMSKGSDLVLVAYCETNHQRLNQSERKNDQPKDIQRTSLVSDQVRLAHVFYF